MSHSHQAQPGETILVTGGSGYLGGWCIVELLRRGHAVRTTVRDFSREPAVRETVAREGDPGDRLTFFEADLMSDDGWREAVDGCEYVLHVASPFPPQSPKDASELIVPARDGTLRVLREALRAGVKRVVVTSSSATVGGAPEPRPDPLTEDVWTDASAPDTRAYVQSKVIAEQAAWELMGGEGAKDRLTTILPGAILGPVLSPDLSYSAQAVERLLNRSMPGIPRLGFSFVDVRDVADLHVRAIAAPEAAGERFLATTKALWLSDVAQILRERLGPEADRVPTRRVPNFVVRAAARFDPELRQIAGQLGKRSEFSSEKARTRLGWSPRPIEDTIAECGRSLLQLGAVSV